MAQNRNENEKTVLWTRYRSTDTEIRDLRTKEENPKIQSLKLKWRSNDCLLDAIPHDFDFSNLIDDPFGTISIDNSPVFTVAGNGKDSNHLIAEITLKRNDKTRAII